MQQRFELRGHHEVDEEDREREARAAASANESRISSLWPETYAVTPTGSVVSPQDALRFGTPRAQVAAGDVGGDRPRRAPGRRGGSPPGRVASVHVGDGGQRHRAVRCPGSR